MSFPTDENLGLFYFIDSKFDWKLPDLKELCLEPRNAFVLRIPSLNLNSLKSMNLSHKAETVNQVLGSTHAKLKRTKIFKIL